MQILQGRLASEAHRLLYHSTLGLTVIKKRKKQRWNLECEVDAGRVSPVVPQRVSLV